MQIQKQLTNVENERQVFMERLDGAQHNANELRRNNQILQDQITRLTNDLANCEVQKSGLESQLRMQQWPSDGTVANHQEEEILRQLQTTQRERTDLKGKVDSLTNKVNNS